MSDPSSFREPGYVYLLAHQNGKHFKIGETKTPSSRIIQVAGSDFRTVLNMERSLLFAFENKEKARRVEKALHVILDRHRLLPSQAPVQCGGTSEWFSVSGWDACISVIDTQGQGVPVAIESAIPVRAVPCLKPTPKKTMTPQVCLSPRETVTETTPEESIATDLQKVEHRVRVMDDYLSSELLELIVLGDAIVTHTDAFNYSVRMHVQKGDRASRFMEILDMARKSASLATDPDAKHRWDAGRRLSAEWSSADAELSMKLNVRVGDAGWDIFMLHKTKRVLDELPQVGSDPHRSYVETLPPEYDGGIWSFHWPHNAKCLHSIDSCITAFLRTARKGDMTRIGPEDLDSSASQEISFQFSSQRASSLFARMDRDLKILDSLSQVDLLHVNSRGETACFQKWRFMNGTSLERRGDLIFGRMRLNPHGRGLVAFSLPRLNNLLKHVPVASQEVWNKPDELVLKANHRGTPQQKTGKLLDQCSSTVVI